MFGSLGFTELILILVIVLIIFGAGKLPQLGEGVGKAIKGFKKSVHEAEAFDVDPQPQLSEPTISTQAGVVTPNSQQSVQNTSAENVDPAQPEPMSATSPETVVTPSKA